MAAIVQSIEISRPPDAVFSYATDFSHFPEWQGGVLSVRPVDDVPVTVGSTAVVTRRVGPRKLPRTEQVVELNPPRTWTVRGGGGPIVAIAKGAVEPVDGGERSRLTIAIDFEARGIGRLVVPLVVRRQARRQLPRNEQRLKELLERHP